MATAIDPKSLKVANTQGQQVLRSKGSIAGNQFQIDNAKDCSIFLLDHSDSVLVDDCSNCKVVIGPTSGSVFIRGCEGCTFAVASQQFRTRDCKDVAVYLFCPTEPIVESSTKVQFHPWNVAIPHAPELFEKAGLDVNKKNNFSKVHDFSKDDESIPQPHWTTNASVSEIVQYDVKEGGKLFEGNLPEVLRSALGGDHPVRHVKLHEGEVKKIHGTVNWFSVPKGFGYATGDDGQDVCIHRRHLKKGMKPVPGAKVELLVELQSKSWHSIEFLECIPPEKPAPKANQEPTKPQVEANTTATANGHPPAADHPAPNNEGVPKKVQRKRKQKAKKALASKKNDDGVQLDGEVATNKKSKSPEPIPTKVAAVKETPQEKDGKGRPLNGDKPSGATTKRSKKKDKKRKQPGQVVAEVATDQTASSEPTLQGKKKETSKKRKEKKSKGATQLQEGAKVATEAQSNHTDILLPQTFGLLLPSEAFSDPTGRNIQVTHYDVSMHPRMKVFLKESDMYVTSLDNEQMLRKQIEFDPTSIIIAVEGAAILGTVYVLYNPWQSFIYHLCVHPQYRNLGVANLLLDRAEAQLKARGAKCPTIFVEAQNQAAIAFYKKRGWFGTHPFLCMGKNL